MSEPLALLIIGGGPAGFAAARAYRELHPDGDVAIVADEHRMPYQRPPLTKELLRGEIGFDELALEDEAWLDDHRVALISGRAVTLDAAERRVDLSGGRRLRYHQCVLATGAEPTRLPIPGADHPLVRVVRTADHVRMLLERLSDDARVAVIGSGFIGCEIASSLRLRGHRVELVSDEAAPNAARLGDEAAAIIRGWLESDGVALTLGTPVQRIETADRTAAVIAGDRQVEAELIVMASGVSPRSELAVQAGLELDGGAVPVDAAMRTRHERLLAAGDVCKANNLAAARPLRVEHWGDALAQGEIAGQTAAGANAGWDAVPGFWSTIGRRTLKYAAWGDGYEQTRLSRGPDDAFTACYATEGRLVGVLTHDADEDYERGSERIATGGALDPVTVVVVPARDEQARIGACLRALAAQTVPTRAFETILVADACRDRTEEVARAAARRLGLRLTVLPGPGAGSGGARRLGMDAAAERLHSLGLAHGLIATTDADSQPAPDWLERQLAHLERGADVIAGMIELDEGAAGLPSAVLDRRRRDAKRRMAEIAALDPHAAHHHFAAASLGVRADVYRRVGGLGDAATLEDEAFAELLARHGIPILRPADVRVSTAVRTDGRARRGLSVDLAVSLWRERRRYRAADFDLGRLRACADRTSVTVLIPAKECAGTIAGVIETTVGPARDAGLVDDIVVVDAGSRDATAARATAAGATVLQQDELATELVALGKGDAMWRALRVTGGDVVCFLDADTQDPDPRHLGGLLGPLLTDPEISLVKGAFARPFNTDGRIVADEGGRVTELMARPLVNLHFPLLAGFAQPLAGEFAARRRLLEQLPFPVGYGVELALLIDAHRALGLDALAECWLGTRQNRHQPLRALGEMALAVLAAGERRIESPRSATGGQYLRPWEDGRVVRVPVSERSPITSLARTDVPVVSVDADCCAAAAGPGVQTWRSRQGASADASAP